jgi:hypothetical protein
MCWILRRLVEQTDRSQEEPSGDHSRVARGAVTGTAEAVPVASPDYSNEFLERSFAGVEETSNRKDAIQGFFAALRMTRFVATRALLSK